MSFYVYRIENKINGKFYIGKTSKTIDERWKRHKYDCNCKKDNTRLYNALRKYGYENFEIYVFEMLNEDHPRLNDRERYWIEVLEPEYNMTKGGDGGNTGNRVGRRWKVKDTTKMKNKKTITDKVINGRKALIGENNYQSKYVIHTPWGLFHTWREATRIATILRSEGAKNVVVSIATLRKFCLENVIIPVEGRRTVHEWKGKFSKDVGFYVENKI